MAITSFGLRAIRGGSVQGTVLVATLLFLPLLGMVAPRDARAEDPLQELIEPADSLYHKWGWSVAIDDVTMVMGDPEYIKEDQLCVKERGAVTTFKKIGGVWQQDQFFRYMGDGTDVTRLGYSVAVKGNVIVAATPGQRFVNGGTTVLNAGALTVYRRPSVSAPFAFIGQAFEPTPVANNQFTMLAPVATNGAIMAASVAPAGIPNGVVQVYSIGTSSLGYVGPISSSPTPTTSLVITDNNFIVAGGQGYVNLPAFWVNGSNIQGFDTSALTDQGRPVLSQITSSGNLIAFIRGTSSSQTLWVARFSIKSGSPFVEVIQKTDLPAAFLGVDWRQASMQENYGIAVYSRQPEFILMFNYAFGSYNPIGTMSVAGNASATGSTAFSGTDLITGNTLVDHNDPNQQCGRIGSMFVYQPQIDLSLGLQCSLATSTALE